MQSSEIFPSCKYRLNSLVVVVLGSEVSCNSSRLSFGEIIRVQAYVCQSSPSFLPADRLRQRRLTIQPHQTLVYRSTLCFRTSFGQFLSRQRKIFSPHEFIRSSLAFSHRHFLASATEEIDLFAFVYTRETIKLLLYFSFYYSTRYLDLQFFNINKQYLRVTIFIY